MKPLFVLLISFFVCVIILQFVIKSDQNKWVVAGNISIGIMFIFTAIGHFVFTQGMSQMIPDFIPYKIQWVYVTGVLEILFGLGLIFPTYRLITAYVVLVFLVFVLPANIKSAIDGLNYQSGAYDGPGLAYLWFRIPLQVFFMIWVYVFAIRMK